MKDSAPTDHQNIPKKKKGVTGKIIGGFILILFGIAGLAFGLPTYNLQNQNIEYCNSFLGSLDQLDPENATICENARGYLIISIMFGLIGFVLLIVGLILLAVGIKQKV